MPRTLSNFNQMHHHSHHIFQQQLQAFHQQFKMFHHQNQINNHNPYYDPVASLYAHCGSPTSSLAPIRFQASPSRSGSSSLSSPPMIGPDVGQLGLQQDPTRRASQSPVAHYNPTGGFRPKYENGAHEIANQFSPMPSSQTTFNNINNVNSNPLIVTTNTTTSLNNNNNNNSKPLVTNSQCSSSNLHLHLRPNIKTIAKRPNRAHKSKRVRTIFTPEQLRRLEHEFSNQMYLVGHDRGFLAKSLNLTESQVKVWFQNRRIKFRKINPGPSIGNNSQHNNDMSEEDEESDDMDMEAATSNL